MGSIQALESEEFEFILHRKIKLVCMKGFVTIKHAALTLETQSSYGFHLQEDDRILRELPQDEIRKALIVGTKR